MSLWRIPKATTAGTTPMASKSAPIAGGGGLATGSASGVANTLDKGYTGANKGTGTPYGNVGNTQTVGVPGPYDQAAIDAQKQQHADPANNLQGPGALERLYGQSASRFTQPSAAQAWWAQNGSQFAQPSMSEKFAQDSLNGGNPYLERQRQQGMDAIEQRMAAKGAYNSGGNAAALSGYNAELDAGAYAQMAGLAGQADQARNARLSGGMAGASGASNDALSYLQAQFAGAGAAQGAQEGRLNGQLDRRMALDNMAMQQLAQFYGMGMQGSADPFNAYLEMLGGAAKESGEAESSRTFRDWLRL